MTSLPRAFALSLGQLGDPAILRVLGKSLLLTLAIFLALGWGLVFAYDWALLRLGIDTDSGTGTLLAALTAFIAAWLLFRIIALFVLNFFADEVVRAVERRHYPAAAQSARSLPLATELANGTRATLRAIAINLLALPFAILLLATGIGTALLFWAVNAWLLGRELQDMVWLRHRREAHDIAPMGAATRFLLGGIVAALLLIPFVNLLAPVLGAASATHLVHRGRKPLA